jgi:hypothetical protein
MECVSLKGGCAIMGLPRGPSSKSRGPPGNSGFGTNQSTQRVLVTDSAADFVPCLYSIEVAYL